MGQQRVGSDSGRRDARARLRLDEPVDVREEAGRVVIEPLRRKQYDLKELVKGITRNNLHEEIDFGDPVGKEVW